MMHGPMPSINRPVPRSFWLVTARRFLANQGASRRGGEPTVGLRGYGPEFHF